MEASAVRQTGEIMTTDMVSTNTATGSSELGKNEFLKLLVTQLQHQDPMNPTDNTEFIAQLAQFTSLEQMSNLNSSFETLSNYQMINQATSLIGKTVVIAGQDGFITGEVEKVTFPNGIPAIVVEGESYSLEQIEEIK